MRRSLTLATACLLFACPSRAQVPDTPSPSATAPIVAPPPPPTGNVTGRITCSDSHKPARGATIIINRLPEVLDDLEGSRTNSYSAHLALDGTYSLSQIPAGDYGFEVSLPGYLSPASSMRPEDMHVTTVDTVRKFMTRQGALSVRAGATTSFDFVLQRGAAVSGHVLYSDGSPAAQVSIDMEDADVKPDQEDFVARRAAINAYFQNQLNRQTLSTDDLGNFRVAGLYPGKFRIAAVQAPPVSSDAHRSAESMLPTGDEPADPAALRIYAGDTVHRKSASVYELCAGDEISGITITIPVTVFVRVRGTIAGTGGQVVNTATVTVTDSDDDAFHFETKVSDEGAFIFPTVPAGMYKLSAKGARFVVQESATGDEDHQVITPEHATHAFADGSLDLIVKNADLQDVSLVLPEIPVPPDPDQPDAGPTTPTSPSDPANQATNPPQP